MVIVRRVSYGCSVEEVHGYERSTGYRIGSKILSVADVEEMYNDAIAFAVSNKYDILIK